MQENGNLREWTSSFKRRSDGRSPIRAKEGVGKGTNASRGASGRRGLVKLQSVAESEAGHRDHWLI